MTQSLRTPTGRQACEESSDAGIDGEPADIANRIRFIRETLGLTQEKLATRLGVAFPTVNRWENGHTQPSPPALRQIAVLLAEARDMQTLRYRGSSHAGGPR